MPNPTAQGEYIETDLIIAKILQEEYDFEYEISKKSLTHSESESSLNIKSLLPKIGSFLNLNQRLQTKGIDLRANFSFYSAADSAEILSETINEPPSCTQKITKSPLQSPLQSAIECPILNASPNEEFLTLLATHPKYSKFNASIRSFIQEFVAIDIPITDQMQVINDFMDFIDLEADKLFAQTSTTTTTNNSTPVIFPSETEAEISIDCTQTKSPSQPEAQNDPSAALSAFKQMTERLVMGKIYYKIFELESDRERSANLTLQIKKHAWIQLRHLDLPQAFAQCTNQIGICVEEIIRIDTYKSPHDKLKCIERASKAAFEILAQSQRAGETDEFLPLLIWLILKAQPSRLYSNVQFIARFRRRGLMGEDWFFVNFMAAVTFIGKISRKSLSIPREEYDNLTEDFEELLFEYESIRIKNVFKKPFNSISRWVEREFNGSGGPGEQEQDKEREDRELELALHLSLQEASNSLRREAGV